MNWLKYSGIWVGFAVNPYHWKFGWDKTSDHLEPRSVFENCVYAGPIWIRVIIDNGNW